MTFTEAAAEVLRLIGRPLHYKKITEIAIEKNLLSHVGKSPEITMCSRLATMIKKDRGDAPIVKVKPGIFGLRDFSEETMKLADLEPDIDPEDLPEIILEEEDDSEIHEKNVVKPDHKLPGQEVFPEEEDDDDPILAKIDQDDSDSESDENGRRGKRRRKKRRTEPRSPSEMRNPNEIRNPNEMRSHADVRRYEEDRREPRDMRNQATAGDWHRAPEHRDIVGRDLADTIEAILISRQKRIPLVAVADELVRHGRLSGDPYALLPTLAAAIRGDNGRRQGARQRPRFRLEHGDIALTIWDHPVEVIRAEDDVLRVIGRHRELVYRSFLRRIADLPNASLLELIATWLSGIGVVGIRGVRPPSHQGNEFHLTGILRRGPEETPLAIIIMRGGQLGRECVIDVRGSLHYYGDARSAWIITLNQVMAGAREEASLPGAAPVALFDGIQLARSMEEANIGLVRFHIPVVGMDTELLNMIYGPGQRKTDAMPRERILHEDRYSPHEVSEEGTGAVDDSAESLDMDARRKRRRRKRRRGGREQQANQETSGDDSNDSVQYEDENFSDESDDEINEREVAADFDDESEVQVFIDEDFDESYEEEREDDGQPNEHHRSNDRKNDV